MRRYADSSLNGALVMRGTTVQNQTDFEIQLIAKWTWNLCMYSLETWNPLQKSQLLCRINFYLPVEDNNSKTKGLLTDVLPLLLNVKYA